MRHRQQAHKVLRSVGFGIFRSLLPDRAVEQLVRRTQLRLRRRALTVGVVMGLLTVSQLQRGIRAVSSLLRHTWSRVRHRYGLSHLSAPVSRQAFSKRLQTLPWELFRDLLNVLLGTLSEMVNPGPSLFHGLFTVQAIDRTVVDVAARLMTLWKGKPGSGATGRNAQVGLDTMYNVTLGVPQVVVIEGARPGEIPSARKMIRKGRYGPHVIFVMDRGYRSFDLFRHVTEEESFFVIRVHRRARTRRLRRFGPRDWLVRLGVAVPELQTQVDVRMVGIPEGGEIFWYFTNLMPEHGITPQDVRQLYRMRWQIELFFRTLKHRMNATKFFCFHPNGVRLQIYVSFCVHVLVRILMAKSAKIHRLPLNSLSFDKALTTVQCWMWERWEHLWIPRPRERYLRELLDLIPVHCLTVKKTPAKRRKGAA